MSDELATSIQSDVRESTLQDVALLRGISNEQSW